MTPDDAKRARLIEDLEHNLRDRIDKGLRAFCSETPDFDMSPAMRRAAADFIMGQSFSAPLPDTGLQA